MTEDYYLWKYEPYGRRFRALKKITADVHCISHWLLGLWKQSQEYAWITAEPGQGQLTDSPSIVSLTTSLEGSTQDTTQWVFYVNPSFHDSVLACSVEIRVDCPGTYTIEPDILDLSARRRRPRTQWTYGQNEWRRAHVKYRTVLPVGGGELVKAFVVAPPRDFILTQPDMSFVHPPDTLAPDTVRTWLGPFADSLLDFAVGDTVRLMADIYNLGFTGSDSVKVYFYDGDPLDTVIEIGWDNVSLSALSDTIPEVERAMVDWVLPIGSHGAHDIHVTANHRYQLGDPVIFFLSEADSGNNHAHLPLYVYPLDYASEELGDPWDMDEDPLSLFRTADIDTVFGGELDPDSISGVCELYIDGDPILEDSVKVYSHVGAPYHYIYTDSFDVFRARIYVDTYQYGQNNPCSLQVFWEDAWDQEKKAPQPPGFIHLNDQQWNVVRQDLSGTDWIQTVAVSEFGFVIHGKRTDRVRISWVKLTRE